MKWDKYKKPPEDICPEKFCFMWSESDGNCSEPFGKCRRSTADLNDEDWYESCEPELKQNGLPWFYFYANEKNLVPRARKNLLYYQR